LGHASSASQGSHGQLPHFYRAQNSIVLVHYLGVYEVVSWKREFTVLNLFMCTI
jgi:hypothetical protein